MIPATSTMPFEACMAGEVTHSLEAAKVEDLREEPAREHRLRDAMDAEHQRRGPHIGLELAPEVDALLERLVEHPEEAFVDLLQAPEERLKALHPLEVGHDDAARVCEDVGDDED